MNIVEKIFGCHANEVDGRIACVERALQDISGKLTAIGVAQENRSQKKEVPTEAEKMKAAMALNLCATSISRILSSNDLNVMEVEYQSILNNLNLQNMLKDESLLSTFKSILDTITFYRLQAGDRQRVDAHYRQKLNSAIWSATSQGACVLFAGTNPWAAVSGAIMTVGAFCNVKRARAEATIAHDDEIWKLERSLVEQLHALRYSLFETAWRLADKYDFDDPWRLTIPQIEQYNRILEECDPVWRYFHLSQYKDCFEAYPYFWNELGESAFLSAKQLQAKHDPADTSRIEDYVDKAHAAFSTFVKKDMGLLREDMVSAAARLRLIQIEHMRTGSWVRALNADEALVDKVRSLACSSPDLLVQCAINVAAAYEESKDDKYLQQAISLLELAVCKGYNMPTTSRLLSKLYLMVKDETTDAKYWMLEDHFGKGFVIGIQDVDGNASLANDRTIAKDKLRDVLGRQFDVAKMMSNGGLFNGTVGEVDRKLHDFVSEKNLQLDSSVVKMFLSIWDDMKVCLNDQFLVLGEAFGIERIELFSPVAIAINALAQGEINKYDGKISACFSSKDRCIQQMNSLYKTIAKARELFKEGSAKIIEGVYSKMTFEDTEALQEGAFVVEHEINRMALKHGVTDSSSGVLPDVFSLSMIQKSDCVGNVSVKTWSEYKSDPAWGDQLIQERKSFSILVDDVKDLWTASHQIEAKLEQQGCRVRVYTKGLDWLSLASLPTAALKVGHVLWTLNPDYEVIRYPRSIEVHYMHEDIHDLSDERSMLKAIEDGIVDETGRCFRVVKEACSGVWDHLRGGNAAARNESGEK